MRCLAETALRIPTHLAAALILAALFPGLVDAADLVSTPSPVETSDILVPPSVQDGDGSTHVPWTRLAAAASEPDSSASPARRGAGRPDKVDYRPAVETLLAVPGQLLLAPLMVVSEGAERLAGAVWDRRFLDRAREFLTTADGRAGIRPLSSTRAGTGARFFYRDLIGGVDGDLTTSWGASAADRQRYLLVLTGPDYWGDEVRLVGSFTKEPGERFFGIGNSSSRSDRTRFLRRGGEIRLDYRHFVSDDRTVDVDLGYRYVDVGAARSGDDPNTTDRYSDRLPGLAKQAQFARGAVSIKTTRVDVPGSPTRGVKSLVRFGFARSLNNVDLTHVSLTAVTERFHELFYGRVLALRMGTDWRMAMGDDDIPFYDLAFVGGDLFVRGFERGRFRDRGATFATLTYRFPIARSLDGSFFYETGRTFDSPGDFALVDWHNSVGTGFNVWVPKGIVFEQKIIHSSEETRLLFSFRTVF